MVIPLHKGGEHDSYDRWRPITLVACMGKVFESLLLGRSRQLLDSQLCNSQAGFRWGSDAHVWCLFEAARLFRADHGRRPLFATFVDIRKAYDTIWRHGAAHKLLQKTGPTFEWHGFWALLRPNRTRVRLPTGDTPPWEDTVGLQQGRVSAPFKFLVFIDDLAEELRTRVPKVRVMRAPAVPSSLLFAGDLLFAQRRQTMRATRPAHRGALGAEGGT